MPRLFHLVFLPVLLMLMVLPAAAQAPLKGMVWTPPSDLREAEADLRRMQQIGVEAVRTDLIRDERLLTLADTLGLALFQELPLDNLAAPVLRDSLAYATRMLELALATAARHPSARHFGLARRADTSDSTACAFFRTLAARVHDGAPPGSRAYYVSRFAADDRCTGAVDFVLLDLRNAADPARRLTTPAARDSLVGDDPDDPLREAAAPDSLAPPDGLHRFGGIAALGTWVRPGTHGVRQPYTPEAQARYLETHLRTLLRRSPGGVRPPAVFVYRWRDLSTRRPDPSLDLRDPYVHRYGLLDTGGQPRPALRVVEGFFTGRQRVFALDAGPPPPPRAPWTMLMGWAVVLLLGLCYAASPRFRQLVPRYFYARGFYRESVREGRDLVIWTSIAMLVALALGVGIFGAVGLELVRRTDTFGLLFRALPPAMQDTGVRLLAQPWSLVLLIGSLYALGAVLWTTILSITSRQRYLLMPGQALMLVLWPHWPLLLVMFAALAAPTLPTQTAYRLLTALAALALFVFAFSILRTLRDYAAVTNAPAHHLLALALASPPIAALIIAFFMALELGPDLAFAWHLATRS